MVMLKAGSKEEAHWNTDAWGIKDEDRGTSLGAYAFLITADCMAADWLYDDLVLFTFPKKILQGHTLKLLIWVVSH